MTQHRFKRMVLPGACRLLACCIIGLGWALATPAADPDPGGAAEPVVTPAVARLLEETSAVASTNTALAAERLQAAARATPHEALDFALGNVFFQSDRLEEAEQAYRRALAKRPAFRAARMNLGRILLLENRPGEAVELYRDLLREGRAGAEALRLLGHALLMKGRPVSAENAFRQSLLLEPDEKNAVEGLTRCLLLQERYREGLALLEERMGQDDLDPSYWSLRSQALLELGRHEEGLQVLETARRLDCADPAMLATLGDLYVNAGQPAEALAAYRASFAGRAGSMQRRFRALEALLALHRPGEARVLIEEVRAHWKEHPEDQSPALRRRLLRASAACWEREAKYDEAADRYREVLLEDPLDGEALLALGALRARAGAPDEALMHYERATRIQGFEARALRRRGELEVDRGNYAAAVDLLETAQAFEERPEVARYLKQVRQLAEHARGEETLRAPGPSDSAGAP